MQIFASSWKKSVVQFTNTLGTGYQPCADTSPASRRMERDWGSTFHAGTCAALPHPCQHCSTSFCNGQSMSTLSINVSVFISEYCSVPDETLDSVGSIWHLQWADGDWGLGDSSLILKICKNGGDWLKCAILVFSWCDTETQNLTSIMITELLMQGCKYNFHYIILLHIHKYSRIQNLLN